MISIHSRTKKKKTIDVILITCFSFKFKIFTREKNYEMVHLIQMTSMQDLLNDDGKWANRQNSQLTSCPKRKMLII